MQSQQYGPGAKVPANFPNYGVTQDGLPNARMFETNKPAPTRLKLTTIVFNIFVPWALFAVMYAIISFKAHYHYPELCVALVVLSFIPAIGTAALTVNAWRQGHDPHWYAFGAVSLCLAVGTAALFGEMNYLNNMMPYYEIEHLNTYPSVDPAMVKGTQMMDAGQVFFTENTGLDTKRSMGFKNGDLYCVVPIVSGDKKMASYDFWAIGKNCCSSVSSDFRCGDWNNPQANAGLRMLHGSERASYRLAVQQAEAAYDIKATHPIFFHWVQDPVAQSSSFRDTGLGDYFLGVTAYFGFNVFMVMGATLTFAALARAY